MSTREMFLSVLTCVLWACSVTHAGRHGGLRSLNDLLIESQSVRDLPPFVAHLPPRPGGGTLQHPAIGMIAPKKKQTREKKLRRILGKDYDERWVSLTEPKVKVSKERSNQSDRDLTLELASLNASVMLGDNKGLATLTPQVRKVIEKWLLQRAACPVTFVWDDLGNLFWPRWVKRGVCGTGKRDLDRKYGPGFVPRRSEEEDPQNDGSNEEEEPETSCSWPAGMHCVPSESHTIRVLRWHCYPRGQNTRDHHRHKLMAGGNRKSRSDEDDDRKSPSGDRKSGAGKRKSQRRTRMKCIWIKVPYPVTSECFCSC